jgi:hypothetical protein
MRWLSYAFILLCFFFSLAEGGNATCLACKCDGAPEIHPVPSDLDCRAGCAVFGLICSGDSGNLNKKIQVVPQRGQSFKPFDIT